MSTKAKEIENETMKSSIEERAALAERLILNLDAPSEDENLQLWVHEAERRLKESRKGTSKDVPAEEVFRRTRAAIS
jgi:putative addiction module component (TIGR02574 family)